MFYHVKRPQTKFQKQSQSKTDRSCENEIGRFSKNILDKINIKLQDYLRINQWKDTSQLIEWFLKIPDENKCKFAISK